MIFPTLIIWAKALFFFEQLFPVVARAWLGSRSVFFWAPKLGFWPKNPILPHEPNFGEQPVRSPRRDRSFPTLGTIFRKKNG